jgi:hypothetical protein
MAMLAWCTGGLLSFRVIAAALALGVVATGSSESGPVGRDDASPVRRTSAGGLRCFGAASRDPERRCVNPRLRRLVLPSPRVAPRLPGAPCRLRRTGRVHVCAFGPDRAGDRGAIALVGDSHAMHWRGAVAHVAHVNGWRGLSVTRGGCPLSRARRNLPEPRRSRCGRWKRSVFRWFGRHPEIHTAFVTGLASGSGVVASHGRAAFETAVAGYVAAWRDLPRSVRRIVVLRDTPKAPAGTLACVERARSRQLPAGEACARLRRRVLARDPLLAAARRSASARVQVIDLTQFFCGRHRCLPVVGGALVHKDSTHVTATFSRTLGPYLQRAVVRLPDVP